VVQRVLVLLKENFTTNCHLKNKSDHCQEAHRVQKSRKKMRMLWLKRENRTARISSRKKLHLTSVPGLKLLEPPKQLLCRSSGNQKFQHSRKQIHA
jgi:hypothetical protein